MKNNSETPMMKQYTEAKRAAKDALLLFRMGDFYELFYDDAFKAGELLGLTVTSRDRNKGPDAMPMAGFPHHQLDIYLARIIGAGYKAAVCEQMEDPKKAKNLVKREVVRIVTPGTIIDDAILDPKTNNYLAAVALPAKCRTTTGLGRAADSSSDAVNQPNETSDASAEASESQETLRIHPDETVGLAWAELSTGEFNVMTVRYGDLFDQLDRIHPSEFLIPESYAAFFPCVKDSSVTYTFRPDWTYHWKSSEENLTKQLKVRTLEGFGLTRENDELAICAAGAVLDYLRETQKQSLDHLETINKMRVGDRLEIDGASQRSLEILRNSRDGRRDGTLLDVMDRCVTPMGSRLIAEWVAYPLTDLNQIRLRQDAIEELIASATEREEIRLRFRGVYDLARIISRVIHERVTPRELIFIRKTLNALPFYRDFLRGCGSSLLQTLGDHIFPMEELAAELEAALGDDAPLAYRDGGFVRPGYDPRLDELRQLQTGGKQWLAAYQAKESERTGIPSLKVGFNSVFGYYIEVTQTHSDKIPPNYVRKQTLKNAERYITEELKVYEDKVLHAEEQGKELEFAIFDRLKKMVAARRSELQRTAGALAHLDVLAGLAELAATNDYHRPTLVEEPVLHIKDGRHPVIESSEPAGTFVPNDAECSPDGKMIHLITGPNMAGKSTFIRQVALLVLMAQTGSFIPASEGTIGITDRIFARVGASDELTRGLSTFMVEMIETARILNGATPKSLVVLDEIGRGTSTYDGISLAWAIAESLHYQIGCRTFFATHYHELTDLPDTCEGIDNLNVTVREWNDEIAFLHKIVPGPADRSYGIHVARLAGVPKSVIKRAAKILEELESAHLDVAREALGGVLKTVAATPFSDQGDNANTPSNTTKNVVQFSLFGPEDHPIVEEIRNLDVNDLTPMESIALIDRWKKMLREETEKKNKKKSVK